MKVLIAGWFSFENMGATAGDFFARDVLVSWLERAGFPYDVALSPPFTGGVDWQTVDPANYSHLVFVCGPFGRSWEVTNFLERFARCKSIGVNLSMLEPLDQWNPFDLLIERDSSRTARPDLSFLANSHRAPVVGVVLIDAQPEYRDQNVLNDANKLALSLVATRELAAVRIDTRLDTNSTGMRTAAEIESLIARMDVILTTRMHGLVLALKNSVPVVAIDPVAGGAKVIRQAETLGWPCAFRIDSASTAHLGHAFDYCLTESARDKASACAKRARGALATVSQQFIAAIRDSNP